MYRLFDTGNWEEGRLVEDLRSIGCTVHDTDDDDKQFAVSFLDGKVYGHLDGCALGIPEAPKTWHVLEFKTHNDKSFKKLVKDGVRDAKPQHYCQMQLYMMGTGMTRAIYLAVNKDTDELYTERVRFNQSECDCLLDRAWHVINDPEPPERISKRQDYYECQWCAAKSICWNPLVMKAAECFGAVPTSVSHDGIIGRYPEIVWGPAPVGLLRVEWQKRYDEDINVLVPTATCDDFSYKAAEYSGGRCVVLWTDKTQIGAANCEIRLDSIPF